MKTHLEFGCKLGQRGVHVSLHVPHQTFVESDEKAYLLCARMCDCTQCHELRRAFGKTWKEV